VTHPLEIMLIC